MSVVSDSVATFWRNATSQKYPFEAEVGETSNSPQQAAQPLTHQTT
jgi:hypothetical protein